MKAIATFARVVFLMLGLAIENYAARTGLLMRAWGGSILPYSFLSEILIGTHVLGTDALKVALYDNTITPAATDTVYNNTGELPDATGGYTRDSKACPVAATFPKLVSNVAVVDFDDVQWTNATFSAWGCKIYNSAKSNKLLIELDFGGQKTVSNGTFTIQFPTGDQTTGTIRLSVV